MQICCQLQTTHSTSSLPISSHQHSLIPMPSTYRIDSATYTSCHHSVIQCPPTHWQLTKDHYGLPSFSHLLDTGYMPSTKHHYILPTSSHLVDIGYVSAESSPTGHHHTMVNLNQHNWLFYINFLIFLGLWKGEFVSANSPTSFTITSALIIFSHATTVKLSHEQKQAIANVVVISFKFCLMHFLKTY